MDDNPIVVIKVLGENSYMFIHDGLNVGTEKYEKNNNTCRVWKMWDFILQRVFRRAPRNKHNI